MKQNTTTMTTYNVRLEMTDLEGNRISRVIDKTNAITAKNYGWELGTEEQQESALKSWIRERGNNQHNTRLFLNGWSFE